MNTVLKEEDKRSHGMHVTSIATGNPTQPVAGQLMYGVALRSENTRINMTLFRSSGGKSDES